MGRYLLSELTTIDGISEIRGRGLMLGINFMPQFAAIRNQLLFEYRIFTGGAKNNVMRLLPPLSVTKIELDRFIAALKEAINKQA
jgi:acetylornithine aminotransferase